MKAIALYFLFMTVLIIWGGVDALAQATALEPSGQPFAAPGGPITFDLGNLSWPGAVVVVAWLYREGFPLKLTIRQHNGAQEEDE